MLTDIIATVGGLLIPQAFNFLKEKFIGKSAAEPQKVLSNLASTKPEIIPTYMEAQTKLINAQIALFNRDIIGKPSQWLITLRGAIIPLCVAASVALMIVDGLIYHIHIDDGVREFFEFLISAWFGWNSNK